MRTNRLESDATGIAVRESFDSELLNPREERELLQSLAECKAKLAEALAGIPSAEIPEGADDPQTLAQFIAAFYAGDGRAEARLGVIFRRYSELRSKLALANMRLVAHLAKRFRNRGIAYSDLLQEGFCGLLEAIDRFDLTHQTKLATYATWWIRQSLQLAVAAGAYPVRLNPRHLRQLAQNQAGIDRAGDRSRPAAHVQGHASAEMIQRIHAATRPTISLDARLDADSNFSLLAVISETEVDRTEEVHGDEIIDSLLRVLQPREREVLALRFGLGGGSRLSLSQVGKVLGVSKERIRQIQDRALRKLRETALENRAEMEDALAEVNPGRRSRR